jgi:hypothetical protein
MLSNIWVFLWVSGVTSIHFNWASKKPVMLGSSDYVQVSHGGYWIDISSSKKLPFAICV